MIQLDRSYYLAASVRMAMPGQPGEITFFLKDLANDDELLQTSTVPHPVASLGDAPGQFVIGSRSAEASNHHWDGLVDEIRLRKGLLTIEDCFYNHDTLPLTDQTIGCWKFEGKDNPLADYSGRHSPLRSMARPPKLTPKLAATADYCQTLLSSSEFLYLR